MNKYTPARPLTKVKVDTQHKSSYSIIYWSNNSPIHFCESFYFFLILILHKPNNVPCALSTIVTNHESTRNLRGYFRGQGSQVDTLRRDNNFFVFDLKK